MYQNNEMNISKYKYNTCRTLLWYHGLDTNILKLEEKLVFQYQNIFNQKMLQMLEDEENI